MMNLPSPLSRLRAIALGVFFSVVGSASALTWTDVSTFSPQYIYSSSNSANSTRSGTFNISDGLGGYNPAAHLLTSATATFAFADDSNNDSSEYVTIRLGNPLANFITGQEVDGDHPAINYAWYGSGISGIFLADLAADGTLAWRVQVTSGDTYLKVAKLVAEGQLRDVNNKVPDQGSTFLLLASGLICLTVLRRKNF